MYDREEREPRTAAERKSREVFERTGGRRTSPETQSRPERSEEVWIDEGSTRRRRGTSGTRSRTTGRAQKGGRKEVRALDSVIDEFESALGQKASGRAIRRYEAALQAFEAYRYDDARKILGPMSKEYSDVSAVHEMLGLCLYRGGQWKKAAEEIEAALVLNPDWIFNHAVLADCHRALGNHMRVNELWKEVSDASPGPEMMAEARIVYAGSLADQGRMQDALQVLVRQTADVKRAEEYHLRQWYVIGDLHDRMGNVIEARRFFERVMMHDAGFADVVERLAALGS